jgi:hypothetical protein
MAPQVRFQETSGKHSKWEQKGPQKFCCIRKDFSRAVVFNMILHSWTLRFRWLVLGLFGSISSDMVNTILHVPPTHNHVSNGLTAVMAE